MIRSRRGRGAEDRKIWGRLIQSESLVFECQNCVKTEPIFVLLCMKRNHKVQEESLFLTFYVLECLSGQFPQFPSV